MLFITSVFISVYLPVQYKLGYEKTKFAFVVIMASPIILLLLMKMKNVHFNFLVNEVLQQHRFGINLQTPHAARHNK